MTVRLGLRSPATPATRCAQADADVRAGLRELAATPGVAIERTTVSQAAECAEAQWWQAEAVVRVTP